MRRYLFEIAAVLAILFSFVLGSPIAAALSGAIATIQDNGIVLVGSPYSVLNCVDPGITCADVAGVATFSFDSTEVGTTTWGSGAPVVWTFNSSASILLDTAASSGARIQDGGAEIVSLRDSTNARGIDFTLTAGGHQRLVASGGDLEVYSDIRTDRWLENPSNTLLGESVASAGTLSSGVGDGGYCDSVPENGFENTLVGFQTGAALTTGWGNVILGTQAGNALTTSCNNVLIGYVAGYSLTTGYENTFVGRSAGRNSTTAWQNVCLGDGACANMTGAVQRNVFIGYHAGYDIAVANTASTNTAVGFQAGRFITTGASNVYIGTEAGFFNQTGASNTFVGWNAGYAATGASNTFVGYSAGQLVSTGLRNAYLGANAGLNAAAAVDNVYVGYNAGTTSTASNQVLVGEGAGESLTNGCCNTLVGYRTLWSATTSANNSVLGYNAGRSLTTGGDNVFLGYGAGNHASQLATAANSIALGSGTYTTASNTIALGNSSITSVTTYGSVGIGAAPATRLYVYGPVGSSARVRADSNINYSGFEAAYQGSVKWSVIAEAGGNSYTDTTLDSYHRPGGSLIYGNAAPGGGASKNFVFANGVASPVLGAAASDRVSLAAVDIAGGDRRLGIQGEAGSALYLGNDRVRFVASSGYLASGATDVLRIQSTNMTLADGLWYQMGGGAPVATDCDAAAEEGRLWMDTTNGIFYVCDQTGAVTGWVAVLNFSG